MTRWPGSTSDALGHGHFYYLVAPRRTGLGAREFVEHLTRFAAVIPFGTDAIKYAAGLPVADFEDAMQVAAARARGARYIITRNMSDFRRSPIPALTPRDALDTLF